MQIKSELDPIVAEVIKNVQAIALPIGTYVVDAGGTIVYCDAEVERILGATACGRQMTDFYVDPKVHGNLLADLDNQPKPNRPLQMGTLHLRVGGQEIFVKNFVRAIRNERGKLLGLLCCMVESTREERANRLYESLPTAIYHLDAEARLIDGNRHLPQLFGYDNFEEMRGRDAKTFYVDASQAEEIAERLAQGEVITDERIELYRKSGETLIASITTTVIRNERDEIIGQEGTLTDVTLEERYRRLIDEMPIGLYLLKRHDDGAEVIEHCNQQFAMINGYDRPDQLLGFDIAKLHAIPKGYRDLLLTFENGDDFEEYETEMRMRTGDRVIVEVNSRLIRDHAGKIVGRVGATRDITVEAERRRWLETVSRDIGNVLHTYQSTLISLESTLEALGEYFGDYGTPRFDPTEAVQLMEPHAHRLAHALDCLLEARDSEQGQALGRGRWKILERQRGYFAGERPDPREAHYALLRDAALEVRRLLSHDREKRLPKEVTQTAAEEAAVLLHIGYSHTVRAARVRLVELGHEVRSLRDTVISRARQLRPLEPLDLAAVVREVIGQHRDFARSRGIEIRTASLEERFPVHARTHDLSRAVGNLLHNAIKYSWTKSGAWVGAKVLQVNGFGVVEITSRGVPVANDEHELVFREGFRGRLSSDRFRIGTGLGLPDARRVARSHGGDVTLVSRAADGGDPHDYHRPFITVVQLRLPLTKPEIPNV